MILLDSIFTPQTEFMLITIRTIIILLLFIFGVKFISRLIRKKKKSVTIRFAFNVILVIGTAIIIYIYLSQFEASKEISKTLLQSGSLIIAVLTFSAQQVLGNVISGLLISSAKPFDIGQKISLISNGNVVTEGIIMDINLRHITIKMADERCALVPNSVVDTMVVVNNDTLVNNGYPLVMECSFDSDVDLAIKIMEKEIQNCPLTIDRSDLVQSSVLCSAITENGFQLKAVVWSKNINDNYRACSYLRLSIYKAWNAAGIKVPYNTVTVHKVKTGKNEV